MKKVLILTDFSLQAEHAGQYAMAMAERFNAELIIANAFQIPEQILIQSDMVKPFTETGKVKRQALKDLENYKKKLQVSGDIGNTAIELDIKLECRFGTVHEVANELVKAYGIDLVVMGMVGAGFLSHVIFGSNCRTMIEHASYPVLYIPAQAKFNNIDRIAFATDLDPGDLYVLKLMIQLYNHPHVQIRLVHLTKKEIEPQNKKRFLVNKFIKKIQQSITNVNINFDSISNVEEIEDGLLWLTAEFQIDMLAMVHRHHSYLSLVLHGSNTQRISRFVKIPLLVFPEAYRAIN